MIKNHRARDARPSWPCSPAPASKATCLATLLALGNGLMWTSLLAILSNAAGSKYQGTVQGFAGSAGAVASILGLVVGGILYERIGSSIFITSAVIIFVVFLLSFRCYKKRNSPE